MNRQTSTVNRDKMKKAILALTALLLLAPTCAAQAAVAPLKPEQVVALRGMRDVQISPDGERVAFSFALNAVHANAKEPVDGHHRPRSRRHA